MVYNIYTDVMIEATSTDQLELEVIKSNQQSLYERISSIENHISNQNELVSTMSGGVSNQIAAATYYVGIATLFFTIGSLFIGLYIQNSLRKLSKIKNEIETTKKFIDGHNQELYNKLYRSETLKDLEKLTREPQDISNLAEKFLTRDFCDEDFEVINSARRQSKLDERSSFEFITVLLQHFPHKTLEDKELRELVQGEMSGLLRGMFISEMPIFFSAIAKFVKTTSIDSKSSQDLLRTVIETLYTIETDKKSKYLELRTLLMKDGVTIIQLQSLLNNDDIKTWFAS